MILSCIRYSEVGRIGGMGDMKGWICRAFAASVLMTLVGCAAQPSAPTTGSPGPTTVALRTQAPAPDGGTPPPCAAALIRGTLATDPQRGVVLVEEGSGLRREVIWPAGYYGAIDGLRVAIVSSTNEVVARTGDFVEIGGGEFGPKSAWKVCGGVRVGQ
jgi:hypothetical protein